MSIFIIAEAGVNHNGSLKLAKKLIDLASDSGANAVKFQTFKAESLVSKKAQKADYQKESTKESESQYDMIKNLELDKKAHKELLAYCQEKKIIFLSSPFDHESIDLLESLGMEIFKIPSGEITNLPYLRHIGSLKKQLILSTGMANLKEVKEALTVLISAGTLRQNITVLHANTMYPTPLKDVNLNAMLTLQKELSIAVGLSDHTLGIEVDIAAAAMGATVIEKHFTIDKAMHGPDHKASLDPLDLKEMVRCIRNIEDALGSFNKKPTLSESNNINVVRKSIVASKHIKKGDKLSTKNITTKRPGNGISPMLWDNIVGTVATKDYQMDDLI